jgi:hypothetical protein
MFRFIVAAAIIGSLLAFAKDQHVLDRAGILGSCAPLAATAATIADESQWWECRPGQLTGYPELSQDGCKRGTTRGEVRYWRCPAALVAGRSSDESDTR